MTFDEFRQTAQTYNMIPLTKTLVADRLTPVSAYLRLRSRSTHSFILESVEGNERIARYTFIGSDPYLLLHCQGATTVLTRGEETRTTRENFFTVIQTLLSRYRQPVVPGLPRFTGGLVGFIGYDAVRFIETIPDSSPGTGGERHDSILGLFHSVVVFDHLKHQIIIVANVALSPERSIEESYAEGTNAIERMEGLLNAPDPPVDRFVLASSLDLHPESGTEFAASVNVVKRHITDGDIFQAVLSQRFCARYEGDAFQVYRALRVVNPSPYLYFLDFGDESVIGSSPEILVRKEGTTAEVYPIAGTRRRGSSEEEDLRLEEELRADAKERAEHIMLVDLARNDLGRVCAMGSVNVDQLMFTVRYSHVMHLATRVTGTVAAGRSCIDVLKATFPAGTVSGAPKIRAMEIIDGLEQTRRGMYAGGVGYFDFSGNMDICIAIRTMLAHRSEITIQAGAGIVADSEPEQEYREICTKAQALAAALSMAERIPR